jgi:heptosyltransferase III
MLRNLIISRTDSLGDVILTLPAAGLMKFLFPEVKIYFIGRSYTQPVIEASSFVDEFINWDEVSCYSEHQQVEFFKSLKSDAIVHIFPEFQIAKIAYKSNIPIRIGTSHRWYHWFYCNKNVSLGRKNSDLHETQLNLQLLSPLGAEKVYPLNEIARFYGMTNFANVEDRLQSLIDPSRFNLILHPKSKGSAREWGLDNFGELIRLLPKDKFKIFISGTNEDRKFLDTLLKEHEADITDITGQMTLASFISFINKADGMVAASTGPLHIASALGKVAIGLFSPMRPIHPGRWSPIGTKADYLVLDRKCNKCKHSIQCECIQSIKPNEVAQKLYKYATINTPQ